MNKINFHLLLEIESYIWHKLHIFCRFLWISLIFFGQQWSSDFFGYPGILSSSPQSNSSIVIAF